MSYSSLAFSSDTLPRLEPFLGLQATNSTSKMSVALQKQSKPCYRNFWPRDAYNFSQSRGEMANKLRWYLWRRAWTSIRIFRPACYFCNLANLQHADTPCHIRKKLSRLSKWASNYKRSHTFIVLKAMSHALMTAPWPTSNEKIELSSCVVSKTSPFSASVPS